MVGPSIEFDTVLELCRHERRRTIIEALVEQQRPIPMNDLAEMVVEREHHSPVTEVADEAVTRIEISLHHVHLPKVEAAGVVEYDSKAGLVEPTAQFDKAETHLSAILDDAPVLATPSEI